MNRIENREAVVQLSEKEQRSKTLQLLMSAFYLSQGSDDEVSSYHQLQYWLGMWDGIAYTRELEESIVSTLVAPPRHKEYPGSFQDTEREKKVRDHLRHIDKIQQFNAEKPDLARREYDYLIHDVPFLRVARMIQFDTAYVTRPEGRLGRKSKEDAYESFIKSYCLDGKVPLYPAVTKPIFALLVPEVNRLVDHIRGVTTLYGDRADTAGKLYELGRVWEMRNEGKIFLPQAA